MNVTALVNTSGTVVERYLYDAYGKVTVLDADWSADADGKNDYDNEILYCGCRYDGETGLYHVRNRYYHPTLGRWVSRDPLGHVDGMSLYEYCGTNPIAATDPLGLLPREVVEQLRRWLETDSSSMSKYRTLIKRVLELEKENIKHGGREDWLKQVNLMKQIYITTSISAWTYAKHVAAKNAARAPHAAKQGRITGTTTQR